VVYISSEICNYAPREPTILQAPVGTAVMTSHWCHPYIDLVSKNLWNMSEICETCLKLAKYYLLFKVYFTKFHIYFSRVSETCETFSTIQICFNYVSVLLKREQVISPISKHNVWWNSGTYRCRAKGVFARTGKCIFRARKVLPHDREGHARDAPAHLE
jgi:hypothetical protein